MVAIVSEHIVSTGTRQAIGSGGTAVRRAAPPQANATGDPATRNSTAPDRNGNLSDTLARTADDLNRMVHNVQRNLSFSVDEPSGRTVIRVVDTTTGNTIRQIPSEEALALAEHLKSFADSDTDRNGLLIASNA